MLRHFLIFAIVLAVSSPVFAKTVYVNNISGDDRFSGARDDNSVKGNGPVKTIGQALKLASHGDTVSLANTGAAYQESVSMANFRHSGDRTGDITLPFIIEGNGSVLEGRAKVDGNLWEYFSPVKEKKTDAKGVPTGKTEVIGDIFRLDLGRHFPNAVLYGMLYVDAAPIPNNITDDQEPVNLLLEPMETVKLNGYIYFRPEKGKQPSDYQIEITSLRVGITLAHVKHVLIRDLCVQGFQLDAVSLANSAEDVVFQNCTFQGNGRAGVSVGGASLATLFRCLVQANDTADLITESLSRINVDQSKLEGNYGPVWLDLSEHNRGNAAVFYRDGKKETSDQSAQK